VTLVPSLEDAVQRLLQTATAIRGLVSGGAREHRELVVSTVYAAATNSAALDSPKRHLRIFAEEDVFWVDSAADDVDAATKLSTAGQRGFIRGGDRLEVSLAAGVTRLDFLARDTAGGVFVTGLE
jgi:hypothetical protein